MASEQVELVLSTPSLLRNVNLDRRSCEFNQRPHYCINKCNIHLKRLEQFLIGFKNEVYKQEINLKEELAASVQSFNESDNVNHQFRLEPITSGAELEVFTDESHSLFSSEEGDRSILSTEISMDNALSQIPQQQIAILQNVKALLNRLDEQCVKTKEQLLKERERTGNLQAQIDAHAYRRIHALPMAVQREHEKCAYNIQELKWHCAYEGRRMSSVKEKYRIAQKTNERILEEINFVKESSPLISEKQREEKESMKVIQQKQNTADIELKEARNNLDMIERRFEQTKRQADQEEKYLAQRLLALANELKEQQEKFLESQEIYSHMTEMVSGIQNQLKTNEQYEKELNEKLAKTKDKQRSLEREVESLKIRIQTEVAEHKSLVDKNSDLDKIKAEKELELSKMRKGFELIIGEKTKELQRILKSNKSSQKEILNLRRRIETSEKQKIADIRAVRRAIEEREKVSAELEMIRGETDENREIHDTLLLTLDQERKKAIDAEDSLTIQVEALKRTNREENHARVILHARIKTESAEFAKRRDEANERKAKLLKANEEVHLVLKTINEQVAKLQEKFDERVEALKALDKLLYQLSDKHSQMEETWLQKVAVMEPKELDTKELLVELGSKEKAMEITSESLNQKLTDMASSAVIMNRLLLANQKAMQELNEEIEELQIQIENGQGIELKLRESLANVKERSSNQKEQHTIQKESRTKALDKLKDEIEGALLDNRTLAERYVEYQNCHMDQKNAFISSYEKALIAHDSLKDKENLCDLHTRLHEALECYYQLRGIQTKASLSRFEKMTHHSNRKLENIQTNLEVATRNITLFLKANNLTHQHIRDMSKAMGKLSV